MNKSNALKIIFWIATFACFIFGYYNTHLGLLTFDAFGSKNGSWFIAIIPLVMVLGGYVAAVQGKKGMLALYLTGEIVFFIFNFSYLYPNYLGRTLIQEETRELKDSLNVYQNRIDGKVNISDEGMNAYNALKVAKKNLRTEIVDRNGFGDYAKEQLKRITEITGLDITPDRTLGGSQAEREKRWNEYWEPTVDEAINAFITSHLSVNNATVWIEARAYIDSIAPIYNEKLGIILNDKSDVDIDHEAIANNVHINLLDELTVKLDDEIANKVNSVAPNTFTRFNDNKATITFPKTKKLGYFEHALISAKERIGKLDTWGVIILCFLFDLLGPFLFYFYLRKDDADDYGTDEGAFDRPWWKRIFGID